MLLNGPERHIPQLVTVVRVGHNPEVVEENVDVVVVVQYRTGRGRVVARVERIVTRPRCRDPPQHLAIGAVESHGEELVTLDRRHEDPIGG